MCACARLTLLDCGCMLVDRHRSPVIKVLLEEVEKAMTEDEINQVTAKVAQSSELDKLEVVQLRAACTRRLKVIRANAALSASRRPSSAAQESGSHSATDRPVVRGRRVNGVCSVCVMCVMCVCFPFTL